MPHAVTAEADRACAGQACEEAIDSLECALRRQPSDSTLCYRLGVCYGGGCRGHNLIQSGMAAAYLRQANLIQSGMAAAYLRQALRLLGSNGGSVRAVVLEELGNLLIRRTDMPRATALREAIECHSQAGSIYDGLGRADDGARLEFNLGNSCCDLSELTGEDHWQEAVAHYERSLRIRTRERDPERHAAVLENLGTAYRRLPDDGGANVKKSIQCYRHALWIYALSAYPAKNAALHNNLGNAFLSLPETDQRSLLRNARRALRHFGRALRIHSEGKAGWAYGVTQYNCAQAHFQLARASPGMSLQMAAGCLEDAFTAFESCGEGRYMELIRAQLEWIRRSAGAENPPPVRPMPPDGSSNAR